MGVRDWMRTRGMKDPVQGSYRLSSCSSNSGGADWENCSMHGVVVGPGIEPVAVQHSCMARSRRWPRPGQTLPVTVDRAKPSRLHIDWDQIMTGADAGQQLAEEQARQMRGEAPSSPSPPSPPSAPRVTPTVNVRTTVYDDPSRAVPGSAGGGLTPDQAATAAADAGASLGLKPATATVLAAHDVGAPPGTPGLGPAGAADLTLDVTLPDGTAYSTRMRLSFSTPTRRAAVTQVGRTLPVLVDPAQRDRIMIDTARLGPLPS